MATTIRETLLDYLNNVKDDIIKEQSRLGIRSSGRSASSLRIKGSRANSAVLEGSGYFPFQFKGRGRKPGRFPPIQAIIFWIEAKPITLREGMTMRQLAFLIGRKIARVGTDIFTGKKQGIDIDKILKDNLTPAAEQIAETISFEFVEQLNKTITRR